MTPGWTAPGDYDPPPALRGDRARLERLDPRHAAPLWDAVRGHDAVWRWLFDGPFETPAAFGAWVEAKSAFVDPAFYAVHDGASWTGVASLMRIDRAHGVIEVGNILFAPALQRTAAATEAIALLAGHVFASGFRRFEWKCNVLNAPSRRAALRFGFTYEGTFRQHMVVKGRSRDTAWFSIVDGEWPVIEAAYRGWLGGSNFDAEGRQRRSLSALTAAALKTVRANCLHRPRDQWMS